ncbi:MAG: chloride channel protein EriC [Pusillimonas sp.]|jgi:H+/Cl- antiporter ClcA|nr:chloride channel protein EriC [Pusillimonas sp.]
MPSVEPESPLKKLRSSLRRRVRHLNRFSRRSLQFSLVLVGAGLVSFVSIGFAHLVDWGIELNQHWVALAPWAVWVVIPCSLAALCWVTRRFAPFSAGSGIPQVIAAMSLPADSGRHRLVSLAQALWKIPLTFLALIAGASVGREGPSVQVGAALMLAWGKCCRVLGVPLIHVQTSELIATGAAGGLAAAFNAPLAGVIFAIEELGRGVSFKWQRMVLLGVLASGFIVVALMGNNPYFGMFDTQAPHKHLMWGVVLAGIGCGVAAGVFSRLLAKGVAAFAPSRFRGWIRRHPVQMAFLLGLVLAALGTATHHTVYGTGYGIAANALSGDAQVEAGFGISKLFATVVTYWSGIPGGIFTPALTTGAGLGAELAHIFAGFSDPQVLALLGMAAFLAGATQAPLTASVITMEMTGSQPMLFWLLLASLLASVVSRQITPQPFYHYAAGKFRQAIREQDRRRATQT